jgi:hypothetical protein
MDLSMAWLSDLRGSHSQEKKHPVTHWCFYKSSCEMPFKKSDAFGTHPATTYPPLSGGLGPKNQPLFKKKKKPVSQVSRGTKDTVVGQAPSWATGRHDFGCPPIRRSLWRLPSRRGRLPVVAEALRHGSLPHCELRVPLGSAALRPPSPWHTP